MRSRFAGSDRGQVLQPEDPEHASRVGFSGLVDGDGGRDVRDDGAQRALAGRGVDQLDDRIGHLLGIARVGLGEPLRTVAD